MVNLYRHKCDDSGHRFGYPELSAVIHDSASVPIPKAHPEFVFPL